MKFPVLRAAFGRPEPKPELTAEQRYSMQQWISDVMNFQGNQYGLSNTTYGTTKADPIANEFAGFVNAIKSNGVLSAIEMNRFSVFSEARFQWQALRSGRPGDLFGSPALALLERPWTGGTTGDLLTRMILEADAAGSSFWTIAEGEMCNLRPDWTEIVLTHRLNRMGQVVGFKKVGFNYYHGGKVHDTEPVFFLAEEVAHFAPYPDPLASYRGMSWMTPVIREIQADQLATEHKKKFFENAATPNLHVDYPERMKEEDFHKLIDILNENHRGAENAYKTLFTTGGADVTVLGANMQQMDFKSVQGAGEPLALDTRVPTPAGWSTIGEIAPGDTIIGRDGLPARVLGVSPIHEGRDCYRVTFNDRTSVVADAGHIWTAMDRNTAKRPEAHFTTEQLAVGIQEWAAKGNGGNRYGLPAIEPVKFPERDLLIDPYVLGAWLGDGASAGAAICGAPDDLAFIESEVERRGYTVTHWKTSADRVDVIGLPGGLLHALDALGVLGNKHIPADYLRASIEQRLDLLRGLMDTDGSVGSRGKETAEFSSKWRGLAEQVAELARSLGNRATVTRKADKRSRTGEQWRVTFRADPDMVPFLMPRKAARCVTPLHVRNRAIVSVEHVESVPVRCIATDAPDHLFAIGDGWVLTHNTRLAAAGGVPPVIVGLSEGMQGSSLNAGNYTAAKRNFADKTMANLWRNAAGSLEVLFPPPSGARLWYDARDIAFLRDDSQDRANIQQTNSISIRNYTDAGFTPESAVAAVLAEDESLLVHSGLYSVQLQAAGAEAPAPTDGNTDDD